jgi:FkbM family methyltransferase
MSSRKSIVYSGLRLAERMAGYALGKGYGASTVAREVAEVLRKLGTEPKLAVDIGGNKGLYSLEIRRRFPACEIHIFEPASSNVATLESVFSGDSRTHIAPYAVSDRSEEATLFADTPGSGLASLTKRRLNHLNIDMAHHEVVRTIRFADYWHEQLHGREVDIVKLDIEGHELEALRAFGADALASTRVLQFEFGGCNIDTRTFFQDFYYFFRDHGFDLHRITPFGSEQVRGYRESDECFTTTNFIAINPNPRRNP